MTKQCEEEEVSDALRSRRELPEIDRIVGETGGRRLAEHPDTLGSLPIETNPDGILALSARSQSYFFTASSR
jgi:hypothetical protein